jgi:hypothetical protein
MERFDPSGAVRSTTISHIQEDFMARLICLSAALALFCLGPGTARVHAATTHWVNTEETIAIPPGHGCEHAGYNTIQAAVNLAFPGDTIRVCRGTYLEQVTISGGKDNLTLHSVSHWRAIIKAPLAMLDPKAIVRVSESQNVTIRGFEISGPGSGGCDSLRYGVRVDTGGSANIIGNHIVDIRDLPAPPLVSGCQNGVAVLVGRQFEGTTGSALIQGNVIERYQKNGPTVDNIGSFARMAHNVIRGIGPTPTIAQNGIQVSRGADAVVEHNWVADNTYLGVPVFGGTGVLLFAPGSVRVAHTTSVRSDDNFGLYSTEAAFIGYDKGNESTFFDGIFVDAGSTNNQITRGHFLDNATFDCEDNSVGAGTGGTANFWTHNHGETESPPGSGICTDPSGSSAAVAAEAGWIPSLAWTSSYPWAATYDWSLAQATIDDVTALLPSALPGGWGGVRGELSSYR